MNSLLESVDYACASNEGVLAQELARGGTRLRVLTPQAVDRPCELAVLRRLALTALTDVGAVLLRGFHASQLGGLHDFAASFGRPLVSYDFASTPRTRVEQGVYSSTEYPAHQWIDQHNEQSYALKWPSWIWFYCERADCEGGATPIADSREVYRRLDPAVRQRFGEKRVLYVRNYGNGLDLPWQEVFHTQQRTAVESYCAAHRIACQWLADGSLRTRQVCQSELIHPLTGETVWFNQAHLYHVSNLAEELREALLAAVDGDETMLPRHAYYGDGTPIEEQVLAHIREVYRQCMATFAWRASDVLMLDNRLMSHGREPFQGARRILVAMAE